MILYVINKYSQITFGVLLKTESLAHSIIFICRNDINYNDSWL